MALRQYSVYCVDEDSRYTLYSTTVPTQCPSNPQDTIDPAQTIIIEDTGNVRDFQWTFAEIKGCAIQGGQSLSGGWQTRDLNTTVYSVSNIVSLDPATHTFTINNVGTYHVSASAPAHKVGGHCLRIYNVTADVPIQSGLSVCASMMGVSSQASVDCRVTLTTVPVTFRLDHYTEKSRQYDGLGLAIGGDTGEMYSIIHIHRLA